MEFYNFMHLCNKVFVIFRAVTFILYYILSNILNYMNFKEQEEKKNDSF